MGLDPAIQAEARACRISITTQRRLDGRVKPGHDAVRANSSAKLSAYGIKSGGGYDGAGFGPAITGLESPSLRFAITPRPWNPQRRAYASISTPTPAR